MDIGGVIPGSAVLLDDKFQDKDKNQLFVVTCFRQQTTDYIKIMKTKTVLKVALTSATVMAHPDVEMIFKEKVKEAVVVINPDSFRTFERHVG